MTSILKAELPNPLNLTQVNILAVIEMYKTIPNILQEKISNTFV